MAELWEGVIANRMALSPVTLLQCLESEMAAVLVRPECMPRNLDSIRADFESLGSNSLPSASARQLARLCRLLSRVE